MDLYALTTQKILDQISRHCPRALSTYTVCLARADDAGTLFLSKREITNDLSESYTKFKNNLRLLALENLLGWGEIDQGISIELALPEFDE